MSDRVSKGIKGARAFTWKRVPALNSAQLILNPGLENFDKIFQFGFFRDASLSAPRKCMYGGVNWLVGWLVGMPRGGRTV